MTSFAVLIRPHVEAELQAAVRAKEQGKPALAFAHLERAHVLGQLSTVEHVRVHWHMFLWGWRQRSARECMGQTFRLVGAATMTAVGFVPSGNTGGTSVSPFRLLPVPADLEAIIKQAQTGTK